MNTKENIYFELLKTWGDSLVNLQIKESQWPGIKGGIMCPACSRIHGRCHDAIYPLMFLADKTGDDKYLESAVNLQKWSDFVSLSNGSYVNDVNISLWNGITVFSMISLADALRFHGHLLDTKTYKTWVERLDKAAKYVNDTFYYGFNNVNYPITAAAALAISNKILDKKEYKSHAKELAYEFVNHLTEPNKLIYGEGKPYSGMTKRGCRPVDLGYNVEESLPALVLYGINENDEEILEPVIETLKAHLKFMLPDGGWDNSWGTRNYKWTYWGSRTSDGCQTAYGLLSDREPAFAKATYLNTRLLKDCTHNGLLYGGPHNYYRGEPPCVHHTFCHAKAMATLLEYKTDLPSFDDKELQPGKETFEIHEYPEISTLIINNGNWRATVTGYDWKYMDNGHASGGALTMLYHNVIGPIIVASLNEYSMRETSNMQTHRNLESSTLTPRIEFKHENIYYRSINDFNAKISYLQSSDNIEIDVIGNLVNSEQKICESANIEYRLKYIFDKCKVRILVSVKDFDEKLNLKYHIPIISGSSDELERYDDKNISIRKSEGDILIKSNASIEIANGTGNRIFNLVPGFEAVHLCAKIEKDDVLEISIMDMKAIL